MRMKQDMVGTNRLLSCFSLTGGVVTDFEKCILKIKFIMLRTNYLTNEKNSLWQFYLRNSERR